MNKGPRTIALTPECVMICNICGANYMFLTILQFLCLNLHMHVQSGGWAQHFLGWFFKSLGVTLIFFVFHLIYLFIWENKSHQCDNILQ